MLEMISRMHAYMYVKKKLKGYGDLDSFKPWRYLNTKLKVYTYGFVKLYLKSSKTKFATLLYILIYFYLFIKFSRWVFNFVSTTTLVFMHLQSQMKNIFKKLT